MILDRNLLNPSRMSQFRLTKEGRIMDCPKCQGLMQLERFSDFFLVFYAWKCINCGAVIDRTIANNRRKSLAAKATKEDEATASNVLAA